MRLAGASLYRNPDRIAKRMEGADNVGLDATFHVAWFRIPAVVTLLTIYRALALT